MNILIVDDDNDLLEISKKMLKPTGYWIETANSPREAVERFNEHPYDVLLIDYKMPEMNGIQLFKIFDSIRPAIKILITGSIDYNKIVGSLNNYVHAFFLKPIDFKSLIRFLREIEALTGEQDQRNAIAYDKFNFKIFPKMNS